MLKIYAIRDAAISGFMKPWVAKTNGEAIRTFQNVVNSKDDQNLISKHPEQFDLYLVADFDEDTGKVKAYEPTMHLAKAIEYKEAQ